MSFGVRKRICRSRSSRLVGVVFGVIAVSSQIDFGTFSRTVCETSTFSKRAVSEKAASEVAPASACGVSSSGHRDGGQVGPWVLRSATVRLEAQTPGARSVRNGARVATAATEERVWKCFTQKELCSLGSLFVSRILQIANSEERSALEILQGPGRFPRRFRGRYGRPGPLASRGTDFVYERQLTEPLHRRLNRGDRRRFHSRRDLLPATRREGASDLVPCRDVLRGVQHAAVSAQPCPCGPAAPDVCRRIRVVAALPMVT